MIPNSNTVKVAVGLGNPGPEYSNSRHNAGFMVLDLLCSKYNNSGWERFAKGQISDIRIKNRKIKLFKPMTYMNRSGLAVRELLNQEKLQTDQMVVVHDDLDIDADQLRVKFGGGHGGHNGIRSIVSEINSGEFSRIRVGIGRPVKRGDTVSYVLGDPEKEDADTFSENLKQAVAALETMVLEDRKSAMARFNRKNKIYSQE